MAPGADRAGRVERHQLWRLFQQYRRLPLVIVALAVYLAYMGFGLVPDAIVLAWLAPNVAFPVLRWWVVARRFGTEDAVGHDLRRARWVAYSAGVSGLIFGLCAPLFFGALAQEGQALMTLILCCCVAGASSASGAYPLAFRAFSIPVLVLLGGAWMFLGVSDGGKIALLLVGFYGVMALFVRSNHELLMESLDIRFERDQALLEQTALVERLREANAQSERLRIAAEELNLSKARFLAAASHDLRQPLHAISLLVGLLGMDGAGAPNARVIEQLRRSVASLDALFAALLDLSRFDAGAVHVDPREEALEGVLDALVIESAERARVRGLAFETDIVPGRIALDRLLTQRAVRNLLDNAIKYTDAGRVRLEARIEAGELLVVVDDTGRGIPAAEHGRVFEEFYQIGNTNRDRSAGLGLGLAIIRRICGLLGGHIALEDKPAPGARFVLRLPGLESPGVPELATPGASPADHDTKGLRVVAIDDDEEVREALALVFESWGCVALVRGDEAGADAWNEADDGPPDVLLCDLRLGGGANGVDVLGRLGRRWPAARCVIVTGDVEKPAIERARGAGFRILHKPLDERALRGALFD